MEDNKQEINESLKKIQGLMYYNKDITAIENKEIIEEQGFLKNVGNQIGNVTSNLVGGKTGTDKWKQRTNQAVTPNEVTRIVRYLHNSLDGRLFNSDSKDMKNAYSQIYYLKGRKYKGGDAIEIVKQEYERKYKTDLVSDINNLDNLNFTGAENQKNLLTVLNATPDDGQPDSQSTAQAATSGGRTGQFQPCQGGINKVGCKSNAIGKVQQMIGAKVDNMFGPKTQQKLAQVAPQFSQQFTDADIPTIWSKINPVVKKIEPAKVDSTKMGNPGLASVAPDKISSLGEEDEPEVEVKETALDQPKTTKGGATNMAPGFVNESTISHEEMKRINKKARLDKKLGRV